MNHTKDSRAGEKAMLQMALCAAMWSIAGIFIKLIPWNPFVIAGFRSLIASFVLLAYIKKSGMKLRLNRKTVSIALVTGVTFLLFVSANKLTTAANAIALQYTAPVFLLGISAVFLRQRFKFADVLAVVLTLLGIAVFFFDKLTPGQLMGNIVATGAGLTMSLMYLLTGNSDDETRMVGICFAHLFTAAVGVPQALFFPTPFTQTAVLSILALGIFQLGIPYLLYGMASRRCSPLTCSLISVVEPILNPLWVLIFDGEAPGMFALIGGATVVLTVTIWCVWKDRTEKAAQLDHARPATQNT
ncbi:MAG: DMT family transporter [Christensenellales bacterium]